MFLNPSEKFGIQNLELVKRCDETYKIKNETGHILEKIRTFIRHSHSILFYVGQ